MKTAFIIRMHYSYDDPKWDWRLAYFKAMVLPKLLDQTDLNFDICMWVNPHHQEEVLSLSEKIKVFTGDVTEDIRHRKKGGKYFVDFTEFENLKGLDKYELQIGLDTDDLILRKDFVSRIREECSKRDYKFHISFQPYVFDARSLRTFEAPMKYQGKKGSAIFALYQPNVEKRFIFAYHDSHLRLPFHAKESLFIDEGYCAYSVHDLNESTSLIPNSKQILL